jgi:hypothetical protein
MLIVTDFLYQALNHFEWEKKMYIKTQGRREEFIMETFYYP